MDEINRVPYQFSKKQKHLLAIITAINKRKDWDKPTKRMMIAKVASSWIETENAEEEVGSVDDDVESPEITENDEIKEDEESAEITEDDEIKEDEESAEITEDDEIEEDEGLAEELIEIWKEASSQDEDDGGNHEIATFPITITSDRDFRKLYKDSDQNDGSGFDEWIQGWVVPQLEELLISSPSHFLQVLASEKVIDSWIKLMGISEKTSTSSVIRLIIKHHAGLNPESLSKILAAALIARVTEELEYSEVAALDLITAVLDDANETADAPEWFGEKGISELFNDLRSQGGEDVKAKISLMCKLSLTGKIRMFIKRCCESGIDAEVAFEAVRHAVEHLVNDGIMVEEKAEGIMAFVKQLIDELYS